MIPTCLDAFLDLIPTSIFLDRYLRVILYLITRYEYLGLWIFSTSNGFDRHFYPLYIIFGKVCSRIPVFLFFLDVKKKRDFSFFLVAKSEFLAVFFKFKTFFFFSRASFWFSPRIKIVFTGKNL